ncbi:hypothetical protein [Aquipuribacter nitratireducens]|uniref:Lipoprotein n=1 Tax=Aquipuribacter nitratireducens TaxID=650104 RepID=A0ABW0GNR0_9MICO
MPAPTPTSVLRRRLVRRRVTVVVGAVLALLLGACSGRPTLDGPAGGPAGTTPSAAATVTAEAVVPRPVPAASGSSAVVVGDDAATVASGASQALFRSSPVVVVAPDGGSAADSTDRLRAAGAAAALGVPLLLAPSPPAAAASSAAASSAARSPAPSSPSGSRLAAEVERLGVGVVLSVGDVPLDGAAVPVVAAPATATGLDDLLDRPVEVPSDAAAVAGLAPVEPLERWDGPGEATGPELLRSVEPPRPVAGLAVLVEDPAEQLAAVATARAAGAPVVVVPGGDPRATSATVQALADLAPETVVGLGPAFGDAETLAWRAATAATGVELPAGGQLVLPGAIYVALYGSPITSRLGVLGEQGPDATIGRAAARAAEYEPLVDTPVVPTLEIIASVAAGGPGADGDYSTEWPVADLRPLVDRARDAGQYVLLDLQPGRSDFLSQAREYEELLREPHVGLALDPEWRLAPDEVHLEQIGRVERGEVDAVVTWLADLVRAERLPQKLLVLHAFTPRMVPGADDVDRSRSELALLLHVDGQGSQGAKQETWRGLREHAPGVRWWGWKNFVDEDAPMLTPEETVAVEPLPDLVTYQ